MKKVILIPDSFKGTMRVTEICSIMRKEVEKHYLNCKVVSIPVADGGEGSVDCFLQAAGGQSVVARVNNPFYEKIDAAYGLIHAGETAVVEMAAAAGLPMVYDRRDPLRATTYGVGELMADALDRGVKKLVIGLGGSATNDGGCGAAAALSVRFYREDGETFIPAGGTLAEIARN